MLPRRMSPTRTDGRTPAAFSWVLVVCGMIAVAGYGFGPEAWMLPMFLVVTLGSIGAAFIGTRRNHDPGRRRAWWAITVADAAFFGGAVLRLTVPGAGANPPGPPALIPYLLVAPAYGLLAFALIDMLRRRRANADDPGQSDGFLVALGVALLAWAVLIGPRIGGVAVPTVLETASALFPMVDVLLIVVLVQLAIDGGRRKPALWLLCTAAVAMFGGDLVSAVLGDELAAAGWLARMVDMLFLTAHVTIGAAALHPSVRSIAEPRQVVVGDLGFVRIAAIAVVVVAPGVLAIAAPPSSLGNGIVRVGLSIVLAVMIVARITRANNSQARAECAARRRATHDALTDLPNRELLIETITRFYDQSPEQSPDDRAPEDAPEICLLFVDLDRFKQVNDHWGHRIGDELLLAAAARLTDAAGADDLLCRIGGDEFVLVLHDADPPRVDALARRLLASFAEPFALSVGAVVVTASIGVACSGGSQDAQELIRDADTAMYKAKDSGRNGYAYVDPSLRAQVSTRMHLEQSLRGALERGELFVHYQPIVDVGTDELTGFEALMRWEHGELGPVSPLAFIPIAEETGLIVDSGAWLLGEAVRQLAHWRAQRDDDRVDLHVSVNISVRQLRDSGLVQVVRRALAETGLPASALWLEITESVVIDDPACSLATLHELRDLGVTLCIDDFGTGYSSLTYLRRFPSGIVKIDRSFVAGLGVDHDDEAIVRTVIAMTHALGQRVVAEGVETAVQRDWLRSLGCDLVQGWLYGRPLPAEAQLAWAEPSKPVAAAPS